jgi:hypothetical protein
VIVAGTFEPRCDKLRALLIAVHQSRGFVHAASFISRSDFLSGVVGSRFC